jgi:hypothetical protein
VIRVAPADEPATFDGLVRGPGLRAISEMIGRRPKRTSGRRFSKVASRREKIPADKFPPYWTECLDDLMTAYDEVCAYTCFRIHEVTGWRTADHFAPKSLQWDQVYEWSNYRLACGRLNARKKDFSDLLDPFEIQDGWFQLELVAFQVIPNPILAADLVQQIDRTITRLGLNDFCKAREKDAERYWAKGFTYNTLLEESPFVAMELRRQQRLHPEDV